MTPTPAAAGVYLQSSELMRFELTPDDPLHLTVPKQKFTLEGFQNPSDDSWVEANTGVLETNVLGKLNVAVYKRKRLYVGVVIVNEKNGTINGADIPQEAILAYLKKVYQQAVCEVTALRLPPRSVSFDDGNGKLDIGYVAANGEQTLTWTTSEQNAIIEDFTEDAKTYDRIVFLVAKPNLNKFAGVSGIMNGADQQFAFVFADALVAQVPNTTIEEKAALVTHEVGHSLGLAHTQEVDAITRTITSSIVDADNIMHPLIDRVGTLNKIRKDLGRVSPPYSDRDQWTTVNSNLKVEAP